jgi:hypothetical protein
VSQHLLYGLVARWHLSHELHCQLRHVLVILTDMVSYADTVAVPALLTPPPPAHTPFLCLTCRVPDGRVQAPRAGDPETL